MRTAVRKTNTGLRHLRIYSKLIIILGAVKHRIVV